MIVDANVVVSASLGGSLPFVLSIIDAMGALMIPEHQMREARLVTATKAPNRGRDPMLAFRWAETTLLPIPASWYAGLEDDARARLWPAGQKDWPLVALALASGDAVWTNDTDLFGTGIVTWNTHNIGRARPAAPNAAIA